VQEMVASMEVDLQVHSILDSLSTFFQTFAILLDESATHVDLLLKGLQGHAPIFSKKSSPPSSPSYLNQEPSAPLPATSKPSSSSFSIFSFNYTQLFCLFCIYIIFLSRSVHAFPSLSSSPVAPPLHIMSINANGLFNPMKINAIQDMVHGSQPHILIVGETKSASEVSSRLLLPRYDSFENPGQQTSQKSGKWGVIVTVRRSFFSVQRLPTADALRGHAVALDLMIPTTNAVAFPHCFIGVYAPWNPGGTEEGQHLFWPEITQLCSDAKFSWSMAGDFNATLSHSESTSTNLTISPARLQYSQFLQLTDAVDVWQSQPDSIASSSFYTCRSQLTDLSEPTFSLIDHVATSRTGTVRAEIALNPHFIPCTDH